MLCTTCGQAAGRQLAGGLVGGGRQRVGARAQPWTQACVLLVLPWAGCVACRPPPSVPLRLGGSPRSGPWLLPLLAVLLVLVLLLVVAIRANQERAGVPWRRRVLHLLHGEE